MSRLKLQLACKLGHIRTTTTGCHVQPVASKQFRATLPPKTQDSSHERKILFHKLIPRWAFKIPLQHIPGGMQLPVPPEPARIVTARKPLAGRMLSRLQAALRHLSPTILRTTQIAASQLSVSPPSSLNPAAAESEGGELAAQYNRK